MKNNIIQIDSFHMYSSFFYYRFLQIPFFHHTDYCYNLPLFYHTHCHLLAGFSLFRKIKSSRGNYEADFCPYYNPSQSLSVQFSWLILPRTSHWRAIPWAFQMHWLSTPVHCLHFRNSLDFRSFLKNSLAFAFTLIALNPNLRLSEILRYAEIIGSSIWSTSIFPTSRCSCAFSIF